MHDDSLCAMIIMAPQYNHSNGSRPPSRKPTNSATARNTSSNHLRLQKADALSFSSKQSSHQTKPHNKKLTSTGFKQQRICTPLAPTRNKIIYKTSRSDGPNSGSGKLLKTGFAQRASLPFRSPKATKPQLAWFQLTFRPQKWNLKAHMWYQLSPFPCSNAAIAMQHHPGNIHQSVATPPTPWYVLIQLPNVIDTISKRWRSKRAFNTSPSHIFP